MQSASRLYEGFTKHYKAAKGDKLTISHFVITLWLSKTIMPSRGFMLSLLQKYDYKFGRSLIYR